MGSTAPIESPLASAEDYRFTDPRNADLVRGRLTGPDPEPGRPLLGEDQIYLFEAMSEMSAVSEANGNSSFAKASGIDTRYLRRPTTARVGAVFGRLYGVLADSADGTSSYGGGLVLADAEIGGADPAVWDGTPNYVTSTKQYYTRYARDSVLAAGAAAGPLDGMADFVAGSRRRLSSGSVAAFYRAIAAVSGFAGDSDAADGGLLHEDAAVTHSYGVSIEGFNSDTGVFTYSADVDKVTRDAWSGGGLYDWSIQRSCRSRRKYGPESARQWATSEAVSNGSSQTCSFDEPVAATLFPADFAKAAQLSCRKAWVVVEATYGDTYRRWSDSATLEKVTDTSLTRLVAAEASGVSFSEGGGFVTATATPSYDAAYKAFFAEFPDLHHPDDNWFPPAPDMGAWSEDEEGEKVNYRRTSIRMIPKRLALVADVDWRTGFHRLGVGSGA